MKLFENKHRTFSKPAGHNENSYDYYDRSARKDVAIIRKTLNKWFRKYPDEEKIELKNRFKKSFSSAFYELFIFNLFKSQGFKVIIHPNAPSTTKRPDFLVSKRTIEFYIEAKIATGESKKQESLRKRMNQIYDSLNTINSPNFFLAIEELILHTTLQPSTREIRDKIETELRKFDPDEVTRIIQNSGYENRPKITFDDQNLTLIISIIPKDPEFRNQDSTPIGVSPSEAFWGGEEESIKTSFAKKAKRYGKLDKPYIICINSIGIKFTGGYDVLNAVWGTVALSWSTNPAARDEKVTRIKDGIFLSDNGPIFKNVSGILITHVMEFNIPNSNYWLIKHPFASRELDFKIFDLGYQFIKDSKIIPISGKTIGEILKIKPNWLDE
jgi:hypothetical protein